MFPRKNYFAAAVAVVFVFIAFFALLTVKARAVDLGIDILQRDGFSILQGKRVGLVTNHTGVNSVGTKTRIILANARGVKLVSLFTPEHGLDGTEQAGKYVASRRDPVTGLIAHSLYGPTRKPTPQMLDGIDVLVYDMQDIGCRSYTYVSTMIKCMEAAGEKGIEFVVLDRPNPLGGVRVEGPLIEQRWISFIGQIPVPYVHGMTVGEIARMANTQGWVQPQCKLTVINMRGWNRQMTWPDTGLRWVKPSPNIPTEISPAYYVATGMIGELAGLDTGCGTPLAFEIAAAKGVDADRVTSFLESLHSPGVAFSPYSRGGFNGTRLSISAHNDANLTGLGIYLLSAFNNRSGADLFARSRGEKLEMFFKSYGSTSVESAMQSGAPVSRIIGSWAPSLEHFENQRAPYLLY